MSAMRATVFLVLTAATGASAMEYVADAGTFKSMLGGLQPGDSLELLPGTYPHFSVSGLNGNAGAWITIEGPAGGAAVVVQADMGPCCNTVEISDSSYVALRNLTIDNNGVDGAFGVSAASGVVHHIRIENDVITFSGAVSQQTDGISTKCPTWGWEIRGNRIEHAGTGAYLGNSTGNDPFVDGLIEGNLFLETVGYNMEIKQQNPWTPGDLATGIPQGPTRTLIRYNVFIKDDRPSPDGDRPNLLVDGFPDAGAGADNSYEIYGNLFFHNPREALLQATGSVSIHDNLFVDGQYTALEVTAHDDKTVLRAYVYNNTVLSSAEGIHFASAASIDDLVTGNLVFGATPISGPIANAADNLTAPFAQASQYVVAPVVMLPGLDLYPLPGKVTGSPLDLSKVMGDVAPLVDFNGRSKGTLTFRGAYAGEGTNPGWLPMQAVRPLPDGGSGVVADAGSGGGAGGGGTGATGGGAGGGSAGGSSAGGSSAGGGVGVPDVGGGSQAPKPCGCGSASGVLAALSLLSLRRSRRPRIGQTRVRAPGVAHRRRRRVAAREEQSRRPRSSAHEANEPAINAGASSRPPTTGRKIREAARP
jgi:hypothetical protein